MRRARRSAAGRGPVPKVGRAGHRAAGGVMLLVVCSAAVLVLGAASLVASRARGDEEGVVTA